MANTAFTLSDSMLARRATLHAPTASGRPAGSAMWAGLGNLYDWIDRANGVGGFWGSQILPFMDSVSYPGFVDFEAAVYRHR